MPHQCRRDEGRSFAGVPASAGSSLCPPEGGTPTQGPCLPFVIGGALVGHSSFLPLFALAAEEVAEYGGAPVGHYPADDLGPVVQPRIADDLVERVARPGLRVGAAVDDHR